MNSSKKSPSPTSKASETSAPESSSVVQHDRYERQETFRSLGDGLYEFKTRDGFRLYAFYDKIPGLEPQLIIATSGGKKQKQQRDIKAARKLKERFLSVKAHPKSLIRLIS